MNSLETLNQTLFLWINAVDPQPWQLLLSRIAARDLIWLLPAGLGLGWLYGGQRTRLALLGAALAAGLGLGLNQVIALFWYHPRPFEIPLGQTLLPHAIESSFPSDHFTLFMAIACSLMLSPQLRAWGLWLLLPASLVAWARVYLGVHFPLDMLGALLMGAFSAAVMHAWPQPLEQHLLLPLQRVYRLLAAPLIRRGWVLA
uniref:undecaprenyl-diphosphatase n=1 Tax=Marinobacterium profundum TaxID=1714300 RepID=UPI000833B422|nr:undecaprenyl-diphosphatase [Marinobacterium profundum]